MPSWELFEAQRRRVPRGGAAGRRAEDLGRGRRDVRLVALGRRVDRDRHVRRLRQGRQGARALRDQPRLGRRARPGHDRRARAACSEGHGRLHPGRRGRGSARHRDRRAARDLDDLPGARRRLRARRSASARSTTHVRSPAPASRSPASATTSGSRASTSATRRASSPAARRRRTTTLVLTTTNGTRLLLAAAARCDDGARRVAAQPRRGRQAAARERRDEVAILCAGVEGAFAIDDAYVAGRIAGRARRRARRRGRRRDPARRARSRLPRRESAAASAPRTSATRQPRRRHPVLRARERARPRAARRRAQRDVGRDRLESQSDGGLGQRHGQKGEIRQGVTNSVPSPFQGRQLAILEGGRSFSGGRLFWPQVLPTAKTGRTAYSDVRSHRYFGRAYGSKTRGSFIYKVWWCCALVGVAVLSSGVTAAVLPRQRGRCRAGAGVGVTARARIPAPRVGCRRPALSEAEAHPCAGGDPDLVRRDRDPFAVRTARSRPGSSGRRAAAQVTRA